LQIRYASTNELDMIVAVVLVCALAVINVSSAFSFSNGFLRRAAPSGSYALRAGAPKTKAGVRTDYSHQLLNHLFASEDHDEEDVEEEAALPSQASAAIATDSDAPISLMKQGIKFPTVLNGSDVRVGIIMARWNDDIISGLYKVRDPSILAPNQMKLMHLRGNVP
jgi:hypothetical protein